MSVATDWGLMGFLSSAAVRGDPVGGRADVEPEGCAPALWIACGPGRVATMPGSRVIQ